LSCPGSWKEPCLCSAPEPCSMTGSVRLRIRSPLAPPPPFKSLPSFPGLRKPCDQGGLAILLRSRFYDPWCFSPFLFLLLFSVFSVRIPPPPPFFGAFLAPRLLFGALHFFPPGGRFGLTFPVWFLIFPECFFFFHPPGIYRGSLFFSRWPPLSSFLFFGFLLPQTPGATQATWPACASGKTVQVVFSQSTCHDRTSVSP